MPVCAHSQSATLYVLFFIYLQTVTVMNFGNEMQATLAPNQFVNSGITQHIGLSIVYEVKIISKKGGVEVKNWNQSKVYKEFATFKHQLRESFGDSLCTSNFILGYIQPGHGTKGRQIAVKGDNDLSQMYEAHQLRRKIIISSLVKRRSEESTIHFKTSCT